MTKRMLIDSTHAEETRVVVLENNRLEDFDVETSTKKQLKGNIYLAKIVRVEPSLQAAFVEFGGGRHGFLAFGEVHPDYYQIPVADRRRLLEMQEAEAREEEEAEEREVARDRGAERAERVESGDRGGDRGGRRRGRRHGRGGSAEGAGGDEAAAAVDEGDAGADGAGATDDEGTRDDGLLDDSVPGDGVPEGDTYAEGVNDAAGAAPQESESGTAESYEVGIDALGEAGYALQADPEGSAAALPLPSQIAQPAAIAQDILVAPAEAQAMFPDLGAPATDAGADMAPEAAGTTLADEAEASSPGDDAALARADETANGLDAGTVDAEAVAEPAPEQVGGSQDDADEREEREERRGTPRFLRNYKIQEVIRRRQILLVQVVKEERGTKGAALTTYISLAGRFSVLMPNSPRGGGISRKITSAADRRRLKEVMNELDLPRGMGLIVRTAGANRPKPEIMRDGEYLLNQWDQIRDLTMKSMAPALIYEEASLIKRAIRDVYSRDVDDILVDGEEGWKAAHDFMRMLMPTHARKVQLWRDPQPLFAKAQVESQLDAMLHPTVQLRSGGYLVINQTEALVAIDVNSGRSTRERGIEETAVRTNLEAAEEAARQLRLRDLAGLIVIDFIDMESRRNNAAVEKRLKDALRFDRARIQVGSISHFGLLEMSRQRLRPSLTETTFVPCPHCGGAGHVRSTESAALHVLRGIEEEGSKRRAAEIVVHVAGSIAFYILNHKRVRLGEVEERFDLSVSFQADDSLLPPDMRIERVRAQLVSDAPAPVSQLAPPEPFDDPDEEVESQEEAFAEAPAVSAEEDEGAGAALEGATKEDAAAEGAAVEGAGEMGAAEAGAAETAEEAEARSRKRRRRRRGGRREEAGDTAPTAEGVEPTDADAEAGPAAAADIDAIAPDAEADVAGEDGDAAPLAAGEEGEGERKRRSRRGGRRRRRSDAAPVAGEAEADVPPPPPPPPLPMPPPPAPMPERGYSGPTPADPFGTNAFSFFDAVEMDDDVLPATRPAAPGRAVQAPREPAFQPVPEDVTVSAVAGEPEPAAVAEPEPAVPETAPVQPLPAAPLPTEPVAEEAAPAPADVVVGPAVVPIVIGAEASPPVEKKRGWWRR